MQAIVIAQVAEHAVFQAVAVPQRHAVEALVDIPVILDIQTMVPDAVQM